MGGSGPFEGDGGYFEEPRHTLFFFYKRKSGEAPHFDRIQEEARSKQLSVAGKDGEGLILEGRLHVDPVSIAPFLEWADDIAKEADVLFDGWECAVIAPKQ